jgi:hypothetical protein
MVLALASSMPAQTGDQAAGPSGVGVETGPPRDGVIHGILVNADGRPDEGIEVVLVEVEVLDVFTGESVPSLPATGTAVVGMLDDSSGAPAVRGRSRTAVDGRFEFRAPPGRYGVAVSVPGTGDLGLVQSGDTNRVAVLDLAAEKAIDLGSVSRRPE